MAQTNNSKVYVDPRVNIDKASFYVQGLNEVFGVENVIFTNKPFSGNEDRIDNLNFVTGGKKYTIDLGETSDVKPSAYAWCDVYAHKNANKAKTPAQFQDKLVALPSSFGIKLYSHKDSALYAWRNMWKTFYKIWPFTFVMRYRKQCRHRALYETYTQGNAVEKNYVFHLSSVWPNDDWFQNDPGFNEANSNFIAACQSIKEINFDGGLSFSEDVHCCPSLLSFKCEGSVSVKEYVEKTKKSVLVFNTPFSNGAHGWKLGEYLALGKAIISLPIVNDLPTPFVHGENIHFVENNEESIKEAILKITSDDGYRTKLEKGALEYWNKYASAAKNIELLGVK